MSTFIEWVSMSPPSSHVPSGHINFPNNSSYIILPFYFSRDPHLSIPLCAIESVKYTLPSEEQDGPFYLDMLFKKGQN